MKRSKCNFRDLTGRMVKTKMRCAWPAQAGGRQGSYDEGSFCSALKLRAKDQITGSVTNSPRCMLISGDSATRGKGP